MVIFQHIINGVIQTPNLFNFPSFIARNIFPEGNIPFNISINMVLLYRCHVCFSGASFKTTGDFSWIYPSKNLKGVACGMPADARGKCTGMDAHEGTLTSGEAHKDTYEVDAHKYTHLSHALCERMHAEGRTQGCA